MNDEPIALDELILPPPLRLPKREKRSLKLTGQESEKIVASVLERLGHDLQDRQEWLNDYLRRYAKYRGWVEAKTYQWEDAPNEHIPIEMYTCQRVEDALYNAVISQRPIMQSRAMQQHNAPKESRVDGLLDYQWFTMADGDRLLREIIHNLVVDGTVHPMSRWVSDMRTVRLFERVSAPPVGVDLRAYLVEQFRRLFGEQVAVGSEDGHRFTLLIPDDTITVEVYEGTDGDLEIIQTTDVRIEHLGGSVEDLEDIVVPSDAVNPQPPSESNPRGAHHVFRLCTVPLDTLIARQKNGTYDLLTAEDLETVTSWVDETPSDETSLPKAQKDDLEGVQTQTPQGKHGTLRVIEAYDRWDADRDGLEDDVVFWIITNAANTDGRLARARYLTELIPPGPQGARRPIEKLALFEIPNRYYGISLPELIEGISDLINMFFNFGAEAGVLSNAPFFFYRAASGLKPEIIRLNPGEGYPLDDPKQDVYFPQLPQSQGTWVFNELSLLNQYLERLTMLGQLQYGGIPQGKASAFRTTGTTQAVLQQGDTRIERILRRLFDGLARVWDQNLALCQRYLPSSTEYRILGVPETEKQFDTVQDRKELAGQFHFTWRASLLNSNPVLRQQTSLQLVQLLATPFLIQLGLVTPQEIYRAIRHYIETLQEPNPDQYLKRPPGTGTEPALTAEQAISMILGGQAPSSVNPVEPTEEHAQKLVTFMKSEAFGILTPHRVTLFGDYFRRVMESLQRIQQQAQMAQAAAPFQQMLGGGNGGQGGAPGAPSPEATSLSPATPLEAGEGPQGMI